jgi:hypothetical protein
MRPHLTSNRIRRHAAEPSTSLPDGQLTQIVPDPPPVPDRPPRPLGELSSATIDQIVALVAEEFADVSRNARADYKHGMRRLLHLLAAEPGQTWQERWEAAGLNQPGRAVADLADGDPKWLSRLTRAAGIAFAMRLIQPTEDALRATNAPQYTEKFLALSRDPLLEEFRTRLDRHPVSADGRKSAIRHLCRALTIYGIGLADLTPGALVHYANAHPGCGIAGAWPLLRDMVSCRPGSRRPCRAPGSAVASPSTTWSTATSCVTARSATCWSTTSAAAPSRSTTARWTTWCATWSDTSGRSSKRSTRTRPTSG